MHKFDYGHSIIGPVAVLLFCAHWALMFVLMTGFYWYQHHEHNVKWKTQTIEEPKDKGWLEMKAVLFAYTISAIPLAIWMIVTGRGVV